MGVAKGSKYKKEDYLGKTINGWTIEEMNWNNKAYSWDCVCMNSEGDVKIKRLNNLIRNKEPNGVKPVNQDFSLSQLKTGMVVETITNQLLLVTEEDMLDLNSGKPVAKNTHYTPTLTNITNPSLTIKNIYSNFTKTTLLWTKPKIKLSKKEQQLLEAAWCLKLKYIFKNKDGYVYASSAEPDKGAVEWIFNSHTYLVCLGNFTNEFKWLLFNDICPKLIKDLLVE